MVGGGIKVLAGKKVKDSLGLGGQGPLADHVSQLLSRPIIPRLADGLTLCFVEHDLTNETTAVRSATSK